MMRTSPRGIDLIKRFEGEEKTEAGFHRAYRDIAGVWTIGYGHTAGFREGRYGPKSTISDHEAESLLRADLAGREAHLNAWADVYGVRLGQNEFDALMSFIFNVGVGAFERSTAARRLAAGDRLGAAEALTWWNRASVNGVKHEVVGLTRRRAAEKALFLTPAGEESKACS